MRNGKNGGLFGKKGGGGMLYSNKSGFGGGGGGYPAGGYGKQNGKQNGNNGRNHNGRYLSSATFNSNSQSSQYPYPHPYTSEHESRNRDDSTHEMLYSYVSSQNSSRKNFMMTDDFNFGNNRPMRLDSEYLKQESNHNDHDNYHH